MAKKVLKKAQLGLFKKKQPSVDSAAYFNAAINDAQQRANWRGAAGYINAADAAMAEKARYGFAEGSGARYSILFELELFFSLTGSLTTADLFPLAHAI